MSTTVTFQFDLNQEVKTPTGAGFIEAAGIFWRPDGGHQVMYYVVADGSTNWWFEDVLVSRNGLGEGE